MVEASSPRDRIRGSLVYETLQQGFGCYQVTNGTCVLERPSCPMAQFPQLQLGHLRASKAIS